MSWLTYANDLEFADVVRAKLFGVLANMPNKLTGNRAEKGYAKASFWLDAAKRRFVHPRPIELTELVISCGFAYWTQKRGVCDDRSSDSCTDAAAARSDRSCSSSSRSVIAMNGVMKGWATCST
jgi:hypothetical protein